MECFFLYVHTYFPKSSGSDVNDISFNPNIVRFFNCEKPGGRRSIGFELKSAVCKLRRCRISSGMSGISVEENANENLIQLFTRIWFWKCFFLMLKIMDLSYLIASSVALSWYCEYYIFLCVICYIYTPTNSLKR